MSAAVAILLAFLHRLVRRLRPVFGTRIDRRVAELRAQIAKLPPHHRRRARLQRELARAERVAAVLHDPESWADPAFVGKAAEVARVIADTGRRGWMRHWYPATPFFVLPIALPSPRAEVEPPDGRCRPDIVAPYP